MEDLVGVNCERDVNGEADRIYYELDGEGDADSSTTPRNADPHRDRKFYFDFPCRHMCMYTARQKNRLPKSVS